MLKDYSGLEDSDDLNQQLKLTESRKLLGESSEDERLVFCSCL